jgi:LPS export ABC transporter protein LptC
MRSSARKNPKRIKLFLSVIIIGGLAIMVAVFMGYRRILEKQDDLTTAFLKDVNVSIDKIHHVATKDGKTEWSLDARTARVKGDKNEVFLEDISAVFFSEDGSKVYLTGDEGLLKTDTKDIEVKGNVLVKNKDYRLKTEKLHYSHKKRVIICKVPVKLSGSSFNLTAETMSIDLNTQKAVLEGRVKGTIHEKISL